MHGGAAAFKRFTVTIDAVNEDAQLRRRIDVLLIRHQESAGPLDAPPHGFDAVPLAAYRFNTPRQNPSRFESRL